MSASPPPAADPDGRLADNIAYFARTLRRAGLNVGPAATLDAIAAVRIAGLSSRDDFYWTLHAVLVSRRDDDAVFAQAFQLFWRSRDLVEKMIATLSPIVARETEEARAGGARVADAMFERAHDLAARPAWSMVEFDTSLGVSECEMLRTTDFAQMTVAELDAAKLAIRALRPPTDRVRTRRYRPDVKGARIDPRRTMREAMRGGGQLILPRFRTVREVPPPLVALADISGSMSRYSRIFLHFLHALTGTRRRVHTFLFGTRLTNVTRYMRRPDPDEALGACTDAVPDWSGGTRIAAALKAFNKDWSRRVPTGGADLILITDGLERDSIDELGREMDRLRRSCRRLIWLNPLLRFDGFAARAKGVRAMLPHVDEFRPVHSLRSFEDLCEVLSKPSNRASDPSRWIEA